MVNSRPAGRVAKVSSQNERRLRRCPDAILVRAIETLGRVFMHREAALIGDSHGDGCARRGEEEMTERGRGGRRDAKSSVRLNIILGKYGNPTDLWVSPFLVELLLN